MKNVVVDFESYYSKKDGVSVVEQGIPNYLASADAYCVSIVTDDFEYCGTLAQAQQEFGEGFWSDPEFQFWAAHSNFDQAWATKYKWWTHRNWKCALDLAKFSQLPNQLAEINKIVFGDKMDKSLRDKMNGVHFESLPLEEQQNLLDYCLTDSIKTKKLIDTLPPMTDIEDQIAEHTRLQCRRGIAVNLELIESDITKLHQARHNALCKIPWRHDGFKPLSLPGLASFCQKNNIPCPASTSKKDEDCADLMSEHPLLNEVLTNMRMFRRSNTIIKKAEAIKVRTHDGIMPLELLYCGARHTRRWSSKGVNVQNLDKEPVNFGDGIDVWSRRWLVPRAGKKFLILDFSQIEPRCLHWLVGNDEMLDAIRAGFGIYEAYARACKGWKGAPNTLKKENLVLYTKYKAEVLGLGYGMGAAKYIAHAADSGIVVSLPESKEIVNTFRRQNPKITGFWRMFDGVIARAAIDQRHQIDIQLPTGDWLKHFHVRQKAPKKREDGSIIKGFESFTIKGNFGHESIQHNLWGGVLTENVVQRMARDVMAEAALKLEYAGMPVVFTSHDEIILEIDDDASKEEARREAEHMMTQEPAWCEGLPLAVEGGFEEHYCK
jgi:DNA polymerase